MKLNNADIYAKETHKYIRSEILALALCTTFLVSFLFILGLDIRGGRFNHGSWNGAGASEEGKPSGRSTPSPVSCRQAGTSVICGGREYKNVTWKYDTQTITAKITRYSRADSCDLNGRKGLCHTAIGRGPIAGSTVACPKRYRLGTRIRTMGHDYICEDRYADWVQKRNGDTFDIFTEESQKEIRAFGRHTEEVVIFSP